MRTKEQVENKNIDSIKYRSKEYVTYVYKSLKKFYGVPKPPLHYKTPEQLSVAVILSAQCTDNQVNKVTPALFARFPDLPSLALAKEEELQKLIYSTGFYKNKSKNILAMAKIVTQEYDGKIPNDFESLITLPGIGRKTANVIMNLAFKKAPGIVVDTHVLRLAKRLGMSNKIDAVSLEKDLMQVFPKEFWIDFSLLLIFLGRQFCMAKNPNCEDCFLNKRCPKIGLRNCKYIQ